MAAPSHMPHLVQVEDRVYPRCSCGKTAGSFPATKSGEHSARSYASMMCKYKMPENRFNVYDYQ